MTTDNGATSSEGKTSIGPKMRAQLDKRLVSPIVERDGEAILSIENYAPFLLNAVSSNWQRISGARYRDEFGLGITDWRVIAMLAIEPDITAQRVAEVVKLDKSAVSRALKSLSASGHVTAQEIGASGRQRTWRLTDFGMEAHRRILDIALANELAMIEGIPLADLEICQRVLRHMLRNLAALES